MTDHHHPAPSPTASLVPALKPPPGGVSDLEHHSNPLWKFNVVAQATCMTVAGILFIMRSYVRLGFSRMPRQWILEDWMVTFSFIGLGIFSGISSLMMNHDGGVHQWNLTADQVHRALYYFWIDTIVYGPFIFCTKLSILLLYLRLLVPTRWSPLWTTIHIFIAISASFYIAITTVKIWQCTPMNRVWNSSIHGHCINLPVLLQVSGLFNTISDALILLVPIKACWNLKMSWQKKVGVCAIFTIGAVAPIFSAIGFSARVRAAPSKDATYMNPQILLWATAEITTGIVCACLPTLPSLFRRQGKPSIATSSARRSKYIKDSLTSSGNGDFSHNTYVELDDMQNEYTKRKVMTTVRGGQSPPESVETGSGQWETRSEERLTDVDASRRDDISSGIVRTVRIEQNGGV